MVVARSIESLLKKYQPEYYALIQLPVVKVNEVYKCHGCSGMYSTNYGICENYWYNVIKADEKEEE